MDIEDEMKCYLTGVPDGKYIKKKKKEEAILEGTMIKNFPRCRKHIDHLIQKVHKVLSKISKSTSIPNIL